MSSMWGNKLKLSLFGESHGAAVGATLDSPPPGFSIDFTALAAFQARRTPGGQKPSTPRREADIPEILSGIQDGVTCGTPVTAIFPNRDTRSRDYLRTQFLARPGHADYTGHLRYAGHNDIRGGGHFSGRLTTGLVFAGGICKQILRQKGIAVGAHLYRVAGVPDQPFDPVEVDATLLDRLGEKPLEVLDDAAGEKMLARVEQARRDLDSVGGIVECAAVGFPAGVGSPIFDGLENRLASILFGIPAVKGVEFGAGFFSADLLGSENNDSFYMDGAAVKTKTNRHGGILGGISSGMPIVLRVAFKPTPSIAKEQQTVDLHSGQDAVIAVQGRHDPCVALRAVPCVEAAVAIALLDALL